METKLLIFVLFATLQMQRSLAGENCSPSSSEIQSIFCIIALNEDVTFSAIFTASTIICDLIEEEAKISLKIMNEFENRLPQREVLMKQAFDTWVKALSNTAVVIKAIGLNPSTNTIDLSLETSIFKELIDDISRAILLTRKFGETSLPEIEEIAKNASANVAEIFQNSFNLLKTGQGNKIEVVNAIEAVEDKVFLTMRMRIQAYFDAIKILTKINSSEISVAGSEDILNAISLSRRMATSAGRDETGNIFALMRVLFISRLVGVPKIVYNFGVIQTAEKNVIIRWNDALEPILNLLSKIYQCEDVILETEAIKNQVAANLKAAYFAVKEALDIIRTENSSQIVIDENSVLNTIEKVIKDILDAIVNARSENRSENLHDIETDEEAVASGIVDLWSRLYKIATDVSSNRIDIAAAIERVHLKTSSNIKAVVGDIFSVIKPIAGQKLSGNESYVSELLFSAIQAAKYAIFVEQQNQITWEFAQFRTLYIRNSLHNHEIVVDYCVDVIG